MRLNLNNMQVPPGCDHPGVDVLVSVVVFGHGGLAVPYVFAVNWPWWAGSAICICSYAIGNLDLFTKPGYWVGHWS